MLNNNDKNVLRISFFFFFFILSYPFVGMHAYRYNNISFNYCCCNNNSKTNNNTRLVVMGKSLPINYIIISVR